ncbi:hypothetical protein V8C86DRAFT_2894803, partial [Haematococcus lacustris]
MSCLADSLLPPCWLLLYADAALLGDGDGGDLLASCTHNYKYKGAWGTHHKTWLEKSRNSSKLRLMTVVCYPQLFMPVMRCASLIPLLHSCLEDPWAAVGLMLILTTAKHLW